MYKETVQTHKKTLFLILAIIALALVLFGLLDAIALPFKAIWELALFIGLGILTYFLIRFNLSDYKYVLIGDELIFQKKAGHEDLVLLTVYMSEICGLVPAARYQEPVKIERENTHSIKKSFSNANAWVCTYRQSGKLCKVIFEPTKKLLDMIEKRRAAAVERENEAEKAEESAQSAQQTNE